MWIRWNDVGSKFEKSINDGANWADLTITSIAAPFAAGSQGAPSITFVGDLNTGLYSYGSDAIGFTTNGTARWIINSSGHLLAISDNTYDIGAIGSNRPRNIYAAGVGCFTGNISAYDGVFSRSANTGAIFFGSSNSNYIYLDGTKFILSTSTQISGNATVTGNMATTGTITAGTFVGVTVPNNTVSGNLGSPTVTEMALFHGEMSNKFRFISPTSQEESTDGATWVPSSRATANQLGDLMIGEGQGTNIVAIPAPSVGGSGYYRLTWDYALIPTGYCFLNKLYTYNSTNGNTVTFTIEVYHNTNGWSTLLSNSTSNWPGHVYIPHTSIPFSAYPGQYSKIRITFSLVNATYANPFVLYMLEWFGGYPAGRRNVESYDRNKNVSFPASISLVGALYVNNNGALEMNVNGVLKLTNIAGNDFTRLQFGGTTNSFPAIARAGTNLQVVTADGISFTGLQLATLEANTSAFIGATGTPDTTFHVKSNNATSVYVDSCNNTLGTLPLLFRAARGSIGSLSAVQSGDFLGGIAVRGYGATAYSTGRGLIGIKAAENWTDAAQGSYMHFNTCAIGAVTNTEQMRITDVGNIKFGGTAERVTTVGTKHIDVYDGTAPVGTLANGISIYSSGGEGYMMDAAGNATLQTPHDRETNEWIFLSKNTRTGEVLRIDMERFVAAVEKFMGQSFTRRWKES